MLTSEELAAYLQPLPLSQASGIQGLRRLVLELAPDLVEQIDNGDWFRGMLTYHTADRIFAYAIGPRASGYVSFHMMPYYGSLELQSRHSGALKRFQNGKSCIHFRRLDELPLEAIRDVLRSTTRYAEVAKEMMANRKRETPAPRL